jgi:hypothetical protein
MERRTMTIHYRTADVSGIKIFYREAGSPSAPTLLTPAWFLLTAARWMIFILRVPLNDLNARCEGG